jgi:Rrf2 family protein
MDGRRVGFQEVASEIDSPEAFTAKILQQLVKNNIINSVKGPKGGFEMDPTILKSLPLNKIVIAIDGDELLKGCGLGLLKCSETYPCPVHHEFKKIRESICNLLENTTVQELALGLKNEQTVLKTKLI